MQIAIIDHDYNYINVNVQINNSNNSWLLTCFYGSSYTHLKLASWDIIRNMANVVDKPWIVIGDCNVVLHEKEKKGNFTFKQNEADTFNDLIQTAGLMDLGFIGYTFIWNNRRQDANFIEQRLDRALANDRWNIQFPNSTLRHPGPLTSDHLPISLSTHNTWNDGATPFKYFGEWMKHE